VLTGDGWAAVPSKQPFDRIVATVGVWDLSPAWTDQLRTGGLLEAPLWLRAGLQASIAFRKTEDGLHSVSVEPCAFMRLRGLGAGPESYARIGRWTANLDNERPGDVITLRRLLEQPRRSQDPPALRAGWFNGIALSDPDVIMLADWESKVTLTGLFDSEGPGLAVVESDCRTSEPVPGRIHAYGTDDALDRLTMLIDRTPPIALADMEIEVVPHDAFADDERMVARLARPNGDLVITRAAPDQP
jgi:protein-L-isoaspartate(D-aspartate) O-methyltransferase